MYPETPNNKLRRNLIIGLIVLIVLLLAWQIGLWVSHLGMTKLSYETVPDDSTVTLDGKTIASKGSIYVEAGSHTFKASHQYFNDVTKQINTKDQAGQTIYLLPDPIDPEGLTWLKNHPSVEAKLNAIDGLLTGNAQAALLKKYPIISQLPVSNSQYQIDYQPTGNGAISLQITPYGDETKADIAAAKQYLQSNGVNLATTQITYNNTSSLAGRGLTESQVQIFSDQIAGFAKDHKLSGSRILIDLSSLRTAPLDGSGNFGIDFNMNVDGQSYKTSVRYTDPIALRISLRDTKTNKVVYKYNGNVD